jgi:hypothetical protein
MKSGAFFLAIAVSLALSSGWLICTLVERSSTLYHRHLLLPEPTFAKAVLTRSHWLLAIAAVWGIGTAVVWKRIVTNNERMFAYVCLGILLMVIFGAVVTIACITPWLPTGGPLGR